MASTFYSYFGGGGTEPVGSIRGAFYGSLSPNYERLDGRTIQRSTYTELSTIFPIGKLTGTIRTLASTNAASSPAIATANHFLTPGTAASSAAIQYSTDGVSWSTAATPTHSPVSLLATPTRFVALSSAGQSPLVSANLTPSSTWSATTGGPTIVTVGTSKSRLCYVPGSPGRAVAVHPSSGVHTLDEGSTAWTSRTSSARTGVAYSGTKVVGITAGSATASASTDGGVTWADFTLLEALSSNQGNIASNGTGTVGISGSPSGIQVSYDGGDTLQFIQIPGIPPSDTWQLQYSNGYFMVPTTKGLAMSTDLRNWQIDPTPIQSLSVTAGVAKKGNTILQVAGGTSAAYTLVESSTEYRLPDLQDYIAPISGSGAPTTAAPLYIRAQ